MVEWAYDDRRGSMVLTRSHATDADGALMLEWRGLCVVKCHFQAAVNEHE